MTMRDIFWDKIYEIATNDRNVVLVCADMGAPAIDKFRLNLASQYFNVGIAEQSAISFAAGLALSGKKVFAYAIAPFISLRCYEHTRVMLSGMNIPVTLVGVGAGFSYDDSGPTHHSVEDISVMRALPRMTVHSPAYCEDVEYIAELSYRMKTPNYVRLERQTFSQLVPCDNDFSKGFFVVKPVKEINIITDGNIVNEAIIAAEKLEASGIAVGVIVLNTIPCNTTALLRMLADCKQLITLEEHVLSGGMGSFVLETLSDASVCIPVTRFGLDFSDGYCYKYGGRQKLREMYGLTGNQIAEAVLKTRR